MHALIDGDPLIYGAGFASDAAAKNRLIQEVGEAEAKHIIEVEGAPFEPLNNTIHGMNQMLNGIMNAADATRRTIFISHPVNFREQMYPAYKANRNILHRPYWYKELKEYLLDKGAIFSEEGDEADDALGIAQTDFLKRHKQSIICTNDKDLDQVPGLHYNWSKTRRDDGVYEVDDVEGMRFFYTQLITGDSTDNIPGIFQHSGQKAMPNLKDPLKTMFFEKEMYEHVLSIYKGDSDFIGLIGPLLWIKRDSNFWSLPNG